MKKKNKILFVCTVLLLAFCVIPFIYIFLKSLWTPDGRFTLDYFYSVFLARSQYLFRFWKSLGLSFCIALGQLAISVFGGYAFSKGKFPGRKWLLFLLIIGIIMPLQVTLVPNYLMLGDMGLLDSYYALILPMVFVPLGTFIMTQSFKAVPNEIIEAAKLDGSSAMGTLLKIMTPMSKSGLICTAILSFLDGWNMVEQPIVFLRDMAQYPLSVAVALVPEGDPNVQLACCVLTALPPLVLFGIFHREMSEGVELGGSAQ